VSDTYWRRQGPFDRVEIRALADDLGRRSRPLFQAVFWASVVLVLLAAINVSGLMTARVLDRTPEFSMRRALGATRARLARMVFVEALVLAAMASALALVAARPLLATILAVLPEDLALLKTPSLDVRVMMFAAALAIALAVVTTIWPVVRGARAGGTAPSASAGRSSDRMRSLGRFLVVSSQIAGALVLTVGGALVVGSILRVYAAGPAVHVDQVSAINTFAYNTTMRVNQLSPARTAQVDAAIDRVRRVPGVMAVGADSAQILVGGGDPSVFGAPPGAPDPKLWAYTHGVTADFYRSLDLPIVAGRLPTSEELATDARVLVVGEAVARAFWPSGQAVGQTLSDASDRSVYTVVGVARDVRWNAWDEESAAIYGPFARLSRYPWTTLFVRTQGDATPVMAQAIAAVGQGDPLLRVRRVSTLGALFADSVRPRRFRAWLFGSFAVAALVVIAIGVCGLLAMTTARRTREVGIRMALGATRESVFGLLLREQLPAVLAGLAAGGLAAVWAVTLVKSYLYQLTMYDARVWAIAVGLILAVAALGALVPALRASRVDPVQALRAE
jgi:predicted permease